MDTVSEIDTEDLGEGAKTRSSANTTEASLTPLYDLELVNKGIDMFETMIMNRSMNKGGHSGGSSSMGGNTGIGSSRPLTTVSLVTPAMLRAAVADFRLPVVEPLRSPTSSPTSHSRSPRLNPSTVRSTIPDTISDMQSLSVEVRPATNAVGAADSEGLIVKMSCDTNEQKEAREAKEAERQRILARGQAIYERMKAGREEQRLSGSNVPEGTEPRSDVDAATKQRESEVASEQREREVASKQRESEVASEQREREGEVVGETEVEWQRKLARGKAIYERMKAEKLQARRKEEAGSL